MGVGPATASRAEQWCAVARVLQAGVEGPFPPLQLTMLWNLCVDMTSSGAPVLDRLRLPDLSPALYLLGAYFGRGPAPTPAGYTAPWRRPKELWYT